MELYNNPANTFVAGFIGSPQMNFLDAAALGYPPGKIGARPEHIDIRSDGEWPLTIEMIEMLGAERIVYGHLGSELVNVRIDATDAPPSAGTSIRLHVDAAHLHWFDAASGRRVG
jgi:sn-glycerol 3-phosphate transport system ATP-binding protein